MAELSRAGSRVVLEVVLEVVDIRKPLLPDPWGLAVLEAPLVDLASEEASGAVSTVGEAAVDSGPAFQIVEAMAEAGEEVLATKAVEGSEVRMDTVRRPMLLLAPVAHALAVLAVLVVLAVVAVVAMGAGVGMGPLDHRIVTVVAVGMTRAVAVAHMMTDPADIVVAAVEAMETVMRRLEEVAATWSR